VLVITHTLKPLEDTNACRHHALAQPTILIHSGTTLGSLYGAPEFYDTSRVTCSDTDPSLVSIEQWVAEHSALYVELRDDAAWAATNQAQLERYAALVFAECDGQFVQGGLKCDMPLACAPHNISPQPLADCAPLALGKNISWVSAASSGNAIIKELSWVLSTENLSTIGAGLTQDMILNSPAVVFSREAIVFAAAQQTGIYFASGNGYSSLSFLDGLGPGTFANTRFFAHSITLNPGECLSCVLHRHLPVC
jgi:hypothetical protein